MTPARSILIVSQLTPPATFSAGRRIAGLAKYLDRIGHRVTVLTSLASGRGPLKGARVLRTRDLIVSSANWRRRNFETMRTGGDAYYEPAPSRVASYVVPDLSLVGWLPFAVPRALRLAHQERVDCVITSSPPESGHLAGLVLHGRGVPWIADLRDGWIFETTHPDWAHPALRRIDCELERAVLRRADLVTAVTEPITEDLHERLGVRAATLPNGFDPEEQVAAAARDVGVLPERHSLVHTGRMGFAGRSPRPLLAALRLLRERRPDAARRLEVVFAGPLSREERDVLGDMELDGMVRTMGALPRKETLGLQRAADGLLLLTGRSRRSEATAKLYEYLATGHPILVLGEETTAARIVSEAGAGVVTSAEDPNKICEALVELLDRPPADASPPAGVERYSYRQLAQELEGLVERAIGTARPAR